MKRALNKNQYTSNEGRALGELNAIPTINKNRRKPRSARIIDFSSTKIPLEKFRAIWNTDEAFYNDEELIKIRDWLYAIAEVTLSILTRKRRQRGAEHLAEESNKQTKKAILLPIQDAIHTIIHHEGAEESHPLYPRIYRRAG